MTLREEIAARIQYVLQKLVSQIHISLEALQQQSIQWLEGERKHYVPLVVNEYFILLPVICHRQQRKSDSTYDYVVQQKLAALAGGPAGGTVLSFLTNPYEIQVQSNVRTLRGYVALDSLMAQQKKMKKKGQKIAKTMAYSEADAVQLSLWP